MARRPRAVSLPEAQTAVGVQNLTSRHPPAASPTHRAARGATDCLTPCRALRSIRPQVPPRQRHAR
eukprot:CAMPEP_0185157270 /NCGR_PEP_ID=MMETSP1139-20130426/1663_1 /TAXON_ID=298111 /ORGANISM="Pavlova sp., Strain CCMP459" /LENGTH=65 /DNA_ID=CAMNT_0027722343 /DNA_START=80 /DNA_END=274 /DNA_ORIENTATION=+